MCNALDMSLTRRDLYHIEFKELKHIEFSVRKIYRFCVAKISTNYNLYQPNYYKNKNCEKVKIKAFSQFFIYVSYF